jgi:hypothetical protein
VPFEDKARLERDGSERFAFSGSGFLFLFDPDEQAVAQLPLYAACDAGLSVRARCWLIPCILKASSRQKEQATLCLVPDFRKIISRLSGLAAGRNAP